MKAEKPVLFFAGMAITIGLAGCGKSVEDQKYEVAKCEGWSISAQMDMTNGQLSSFAQSIQNAPLLPGETQAWEGMWKLEMSGLKNSLDPAKFKQSAQDGQSLYATQKQNNDLSGAMSFDKECVDNWSKLSGSN